VNAPPEYVPSIPAADTAEASPHDRDPAGARRKFVAALALAAALGVWCVERASDFQQPERGSENLEASYHVLLTLTALGRTSPADHLFLPLVSLDRASDKRISWGATLPTPSGDQIYTSFSAVGFAVPYLAFRLARVEPSLAGLLSSTARCS
jgi:hypothetical protein